MKIHDCEPGRKFGRLTLIEVTSKRGGAWRCRCDCGAIVEDERSRIVSGHTKSCGCLNTDMIAALRRTHGKSKTAEYRTWMGLRNRCLNPNNPKYRIYGARGIKVCKRWNKFENFISDMGPRPSTQHSIERVDTNGNYEPSNCIWGTKLQQANNRRDNLVVKANGVTRTAREWARQTGIKYSTIRWRVLHGRKPEEAIAA